jgi:hypothetical protein
MTRITTTLAWLLSANLLVPAAASQKPETEEPQADKGEYHLFNPTPIELLRPMTVDGPGETDTPYTVDAGHFQVEMVLLGYSAYENVFEGVNYRYDWWSIGPINLKVGLFNQLDLQLILEPYNHAYEREHGYYAVSSSGLGDTTLRLKLNCWGNDGGPTAFAIMPYFRFPTSEAGVGNTNLEAGLIFPFSLALPAEFHLGLTTKFAKLRSQKDSDYHTEYINSISLARELFWDLEGYVEFFSAVSTERDVGWAGTFNTGLLYWLSDDLQINTGVEIGLTSWADDWYGFVGMAWRY